MRNRKTYLGKVCAKHRDLLGERFPANHTCIQCARDAGAKLRRARGIAPRAKADAEISAARIRARDLERNRRRRTDPAYNIKQIERKRLWRAKNRDRHLAVSRASERAYKLANPHRRLAKNLRHRLRKAMLGETRGISAVRDLGISIESFRAYIEKLFSPGMSWSNYGKWHLDHIRPLTVFDLSDDAQVRRACHYTNIQPLWARDNQAKYCKPHPERWSASWRFAEDILK